MNIAEHNLKRLRGCRELYRQRIEDLSDPPLSEWELSDEWMLSAAIIEFESNLKKWAEDRAKAEGGAG